MWSVSVVVLLPCDDFRPGLRQRREQGFVEAFVAEAAIEAFHEAVLHWLARRDVMPVDVRVLAPFQNGHACHLRAIIGNNRSWLSSPGDDSIEFPCEPTT